MHTETKFDVIVLGGGLLGCFAARNLMKYTLSVALIEAENDVCTGISKANTAIVYSGIDTKPETLKTKLCVEACKNFNTLCKQLGVRFKRCGSLMVSYGPKADERLKRKFEQGIQNGVEDIKLLTGEQAEAMEPNLAKGISSAIYVPATGTVMPWELGIAAFENAVSNGCKPFLNTEVSNISCNEEGYCIETNNGTFFAKSVINCCGLNAHKIQELISPPNVRVIPDKADYIILDDSASNFVEHIIFHEPEDKGKGLTLVPTTEGKLLLGPSEQPGDGELSYSTTAVGIKNLQEQAGNIIPSLDLSQTIRNFGALRPNPFYVSNIDGQWIAEKKSISNFTIDNPYKGFYSLIGIKTPGLTCADALGNHLSQKIADYLNPEQNPDFNPLREAPVCVRELSYDDRKKLIDENSDYAKIICRCGDVTQGEVVDAIRRGAVSIDGVKRRVGSGLGRCQGSFCTDKVMHLISQETGIPLCQITLDKKGTEILGGQDYETH